MSNAIKGTCEDGCGRTFVWVEVRTPGWLLLCDSCAFEKGLLYGRKPESEGVSLEEHQQERSHSSDWAFKR